jgi:CheY-like chemotaxis protein
VEDNPGDIWLMREALRLAHVPAQVAVARDGIEATRYLHEVEGSQANFPDLVLLDLNLPRRNGREVLADMKRSKALREIPVVVLSSSSAEEDKRQAYQLNATDFMTKPDSLPGYVEMVHGMDRFWTSGSELGHTA